MTNTGCSISKCVSNSIIIKDIKYYPFPKDKQLTETWKSIINRQIKDFHYKSDSKLCSIHFHRNAMTSDRELKDFALPRFFRLTGNNSDGTVQRCCIMGCNSTSITTDSMNFYPFPDNRKACDEWVNAIRMKNFQNILPNKNKFVCHLHFPFGTPANEISNLVPSVFFRKRFLNGDIIQRNEEQSNETSKVVQEPIVEAPKEKQPDLIVIDDNDDEEEVKDESITTGNNLPTKILRNIQFYETANGKLRREIELLRRRYIQTKQSTDTIL